MYFDKSAESIEIELKYSIQLIPRRRGKLLQMSLIVYDPIVDNHMK